MARMVYVQLEPIWTGEISVVVFNSDVPPQASVGPGSDTEAGEEMRNFVCGRM